MQTLSLYLMFIGWEDCQNNILILASKYSRHCKISQMSPQPGAYFVLHTGLCLSVCVFQSTEQPQF